MFRAIALIDKQEDGVIVLVSCAWDSLECRGTGSAEGSKPRAQ